MTKKKITPKEYAKFWKKLPCPVRPSKAEIKFWEKAVKDTLKKNKAPRALVLGVTPEIRDLLAKYKIDTICLDINPFMTKAMTLALNRRNPREKIVLSNWLKMPFKKNSFNLVLSDCAQDNIPYKSFDKFFENVFKVLKSNGYWLLGASHFTSYKDGISIDKYIKVYRKNPKAFQKIDARLYWFIKVSCNRKFYNNQRKLGTWKRINDELEKYATKDKINKKELKDLSVSAPDIGRVLVVDNFSWITLKEFYKFFKKHHFKIIAKMQDKSLLISKFKHAFVLKKK